jgi:HprK-related kinase A
VSAGALAGRAGGVVLRLHPFTVRLRSSIDAVQRHVDRFYAGCETSDEVFVDFDVALWRGAGLRRWWRPQARFALDRRVSFHPLPVSQAAPMLEWGLNWCVAQRPLGFVVMHAAVVAQGDRALLLPGEPGAGKSTLCASLALIERWRLLSDELAILDPADVQLRPHPRPIGVKNRSIDIVADFPGAVVGPRYHDTRKGMVAHVACPADSAADAARRATVAWVVFPRFDASASPLLEEIPRAEAFAAIAEQSFNKDAMGEQGFAAVCRMLTPARCYRMVYRSTDEGLDMVRRIQQR